MRNKQLGFSLAEVLVATLIFSVGLLGVAAAQLKAIQTTKLAYEYSIMSSQLYSFTERLKANKDSQYLARELKLWQTENKAIITNAIGEYQNGKLSIRWDKKSVSLMGF